MEIFLLYVTFLVLFYFTKLNNNLEDKKVFISRKGENILVVKSLYGYYFITKKKELYFDNKLKALLYLFKKGYIPFR